MNHVRWPLQMYVTDLALQIQRIVVDCWESKLVQQMTWFGMRNLSQDSSGKWRSIGTPSKNATILVLIVPGGSNPLTHCMITAYQCKGLCRYVDSTALNSSNFIQTKQLKWKKHEPPCFPFILHSQKTQFLMFKQHRKIYKFTIQIIKLSIFARSNFECLRCPSRQITTTFRWAPNCFSSQFLIWPWHEFLWLWYIPCLQTE